MHLAGSHSKTPVMFRHGGYCIVSDAVLIFFKMSSGVSSLHILKRSNKGQVLIVAGWILFHSSLIF